MIEVEAAEDILIGVAGTRMLSRDQAGHVLDYLADARQRAVCKIPVANCSLRTGRRHADLSERAAVDDDVAIALWNLHPFIESLDLGDGR